MRRWWYPLVLAGLGCGDLRPEVAETPSGDSSTSSPSTSSLTSGDDTIAATGSGPGTTGTATMADDTGTTGLDGSESGDDPSGEPTYDAVRQKSSHNSYQRSEALVDQLAYHRIRSLELDLHVGKFAQSTVAGDWFVYHTDIVDDGTSCRMLSDCLTDVMTMAQAIPEHEVITLWLDLKDDWESEHTPADLDARLAEQLGDVMWGPADLLGRCPGASDLASAATSARCGWPSLPAMRGRVVVALTGADATDTRSPLSTYLDEGSAAFVAPSISTAEDLRSPSPDVAIYNTHANDTDAIAAASTAGFVVRAWGANTQGTWDQASQAGAHHLATDLINFHRDPWTITHNDQGWPFTCIGPCDRPQPGPEPGDMIGIEVDSGDIWGTADDMLLLYQDLGAAPGGAWQALISTPNSWVERYSKGCLMARAGLAPDAPYFAVCRLGENERIRVQWRSTPGADSSDIEHDIVLPDTIEPQSAAWVRLEVDNDGLCATGYGAWQEGEWVQIDSRCFEQPLTHQGLAQASNGDGLIKMLFLDPRHNDTNIGVADLTAAAMGGARGQGFDGPFL